MGLYCIQNLVSYCQGDLQNPLLNSFQVYIVVSWHVALCSLVVKYQCLEGLNPKMEATLSYKHGTQQEDYTVQHRKA
jgi:hypothetical protein